MAKVITFSQEFPDYHARAGDKTFFVEKFIEWYFDTQEHNDDVRSLLYGLNKDKFTLKQVDAFVDELNPEIREWKSHTIRAGHRFKAGDKFSPRVWSGVPYKSSQLILAPDILIPKVYDFQIKKTWDKELRDHMVESGNTDYYDLHECFVNNESLPTPAGVIASSDGLSYDDFRSWFKIDKAKNDLHFDGQIILWNDKIDYD